MEALGYNEYSFAEVIGTIRLNVMMVTFGMAFVACVAASRSPDWESPTR